jgi:hypothetical protein
MHSYQVSDDFGDLVSIGNYADTPRPATDMAIMNPSWNIERGSRLPAHRFRASAQIEVSLWTTGIGI